jgi:hypothetical protein
MGRRGHPGQRLYRLPVGARPLDFLRYTVRRFRSPSIPVLSRGPFALFARPEGFKLYRRERELTRRVGLGFSWRAEDGFADDSSFQEELLFWRANRLTVRRTHPGRNGVGLTYDFSWEDGLHLRCGIRLETAAPLQDPKITLMVNPDYKAWMAGIHQGAFPAFRGWMNVGIPDPRCLSAGVREGSDFGGHSLAPLVLSFDHAVHAVENADARTHARVISACYPGLRERGTFTGSIRIMTHARELERWIEFERRRSLREVIPRP